MSSDFLGLTGSIVGAAGSIYSNIVNNDYNSWLTERNRQHQLYLLGLQQQWAEQQANMQDYRTRNLYKDLQSPEAMVQQLKDAGLSVGLMYGGGGMGGSMTQGAKADNVAATQAQTFPSNPIFDVSTASLLANMEKTQAETKKIKAEAEKTEEEVENTKKLREVMDEQIKEIDQKIKESQQNIKNRIEEAKLTQAKTEETKENTKYIKTNEAYLKTLTDLNEIDLKTREQLNWATIYEIENKINLLDKQAEKAGIDAEIARRTKEDMITKISTETLMLVYEYQNIQPEEYNKIKEEVRAMKNANDVEEAINNALDRFNPTDKGGGRGFAKVARELLTLLIDIIRSFKGK